MICGSETTAVAEHICSKMRQLFHELRSVLNSESTTCFTDGHKRSDAALTAVCPFAHIHTATVMIPNFCYFCDTRASFLTRPYTFSFVTFTSGRCNKRANIARRQRRPCLRFVHDFESVVFKALSSCVWRHFSTERTAMRPLRGPDL